MVRDHEVEVAGRRLQQAKCAERGRLRLHREPEPLQVFLKKLEQLWFIVY